MRRCCLCRCGLYAVYSVDCGLWVLCSVYCVLFCEIILKCTHTHTHTHTVCTHPTGVPRHGHTGSILDPLEVLLGPLAGGGGGPVGQCAVGQGQWEKVGSGGTAAQPHPRHQAPGGLHSTGTTEARFFRFRFHFPVGVQRPHHPHRGPQRPGGGACGEWHQSAAPF